MSAPSDAVWIVRELLEEILGMVHFKESPGGVRGEEGRREELGEGGARLGKPNRRGGEGDDRRGL